MSPYHDGKLSLGAKNEADIVMMKTDAIKRVKVLTMLFQPDSLKPNIKADMDFLASEDMTEVCENYGQIISLNLPDPSRSYATGNGVEGAVVGEMSTITLQAITFDGKLCEDPTQ